MVIPVDTNVRFIATAADVIHDFASPSLGLKVDAMPGRLNQASVLAQRIGSFYGQCSELCGVMHGFMVRHLGFWVEVTKVIRVTTNTLVESYLGKLESSLLNIACKLKDQIDRNKDLLYLGDPLFLWLKLYCLNIIQLVTRTWVSSSLYYWLYHSEYLWGMNTNISGLMNRVVPHYLELESYESKGTNSYSKANLGRPKVSNFSTLWSQSDRSTRLGKTTFRYHLGSVAGELISGIRSYSVGLHNNVPSKLISLQKYCNDNIDKMIDRKLYNVLYDPKMYEIVYDKLKSKPGNMTPGLTPDTLDGLNIEFINKVILSLKNESFKFKPSRTIEILKTNGVFPLGKNKVRRLGIASPRDKIVMGVMCMILEIIFEPRFSNCSHGFRPGRGCHTALKQAESSLKSSVYVIEGDIKGCFDNINHGILMSILNKHITDKRFLNLIAKSLKAGYGEHLQNLKYDIVSQGSVLSPILCNIYLDSLDKFIIEIEKDFNKGTKSTRNKEYHRISTKARRARENNNMELAKQYRQQIKHIPYTIQDNTFRKLVYIRYADDWIIGIKGTHEEVKDILNKVKEFLKVNLQLTVSDEKTKITHINKNKVLFLGTHISRSKVVHVSSRVHNKNGKFETVAQRMRKLILLEAPLIRIRHKLTDAKFMAKGKPCPKFVWSVLQPKQILSLYNSVFRGYINYYNFTSNRSKLVSFIRWVMFFSLGRTLATKFSTRVSKIVQKFGINYQFINPESKNPGLWKPSYKANLGAAKFKINVDTRVNSLYATSKSIARLDNLSCSSCGSTHKVEMHHIRYMKDLNPKARVIDALMAKANRKQTPLCRVCHLRHHHQNK